MYVQIKKKKQKKKQIKQIRNKKKIYEIDILFLKISQDIQRIKGKKIIKVKPIRRMKRIVLIINKIKKMIQTKNKTKLKSR